VSVSYEHAKTIEQHAILIWSGFSPERRMEITRTSTLADADRKFDLANIQDKHLYTVMA
jgi:hypothetical protein